MGNFKSACLSLTHRAHYRGTQRSIKYGEDRARGLRDDFVGGGARQMGCGANAARGIADAENDQVRRAFFGCRKYPFGRVSIFDERLWREVKIGVGWNSFIKLMNGFGHGQLEPSLVVFAAFKFITAISAVSIAIGRFPIGRDLRCDVFARRAQHGTALRRIFVYLRPGWVGTEDLGRDFRAGGQLEWRPNRLFLHGEKDDARSSNEDGEARDGAD